MTSRILILIAGLCSCLTVRAVDMRTVPPMDDTDWPQVVELKGRDVEAIDVALRQFRESQFSTSGDLKHFAVEVRRHGDKLAVAFVPEYHEASQRALPAQNKYGTYITYFISLRSLKIVGYHFERD